MVFTKLKVVFILPINLKMWHLLSIYFENFLVFLMFRQAEKALVYQKIFSLSKYH
jgi:hypothetical protein